MFWEVFSMLCKSKGLTANAVCKELGFSNATATKWKKGADPSGKSLQKIASYFGVSTDFLLTGEGTKKEPSQPDDRWKRYEKQINELPASSQERLMKQFQAMIDIEKESHRNQ